MIKEWLYEKFIIPHCHYYTVETTLLYGLIFVVAVVGVYKLLQKLKIKIDRNLFLAVIPFILYGGWTRALGDHGLYQGWWWCSPFIYVIVFCIAIASLLIGVGFKKIPYYKTMIILGIIPLLYNLTITKIDSFYAATIVLPITILLFGALLGVNRFKPKILSKLNASIIGVHLFDAAATFTALTFFTHLREEHVLPSFLIGHFGPWVMFPLKLLVIWGVLYIIDKYGDDKQFSNFLKLAIFILGMAQGTRDLLTMML
jgi:uncharacterized membrane protein